MIPFPAEPVPSAPAMLAQAIDAGDVDTVRQVLDVATRIGVGPPPALARAALDLLAQHDGKESS